MTTEIQQNKAIQYDTEIRRLRNLLETSFLELAKNLYEFNNSKGYLVMGYPSLKSYCANPDVDINVRTAYRLIGVYSKYVLDLKVPPVALIECGHTKLEMLRPFITEENKDEYVNMAATLSKADIIEELKRREPDFEPPALIVDYDLVQAAWKDINDEVIHEVTLSNARVTRATPNFSLTGKIENEDTR